MKSYLAERRAGAERRSAMGRVVLVVAAALAVSAPGTLGIALAADEAPELPAYFSASSADPQKPAWPDPTGGNSGVWATPAGDGKGDIPDQLKLGDLYDRIAHNLY